MILYMINIDKIFDNIEMKNLFNIILNKKNIKIINYLFKIAI